MEQLIHCRLATRNDLEAIVAMLADDKLGAQRETFALPLPDEYCRAFAAIDADANNELVVACMDEKIVGVLQITFIPNLTYRGSWRAQIEGVRTQKDMRAQGVGTALVKRAIERARERNCALVQLTTDKQRPAAIAFYERLGFRASHEGMKLKM